MSAAEPGPAQHKLFDGGGLFLQVMPNGAKYWRLKYRVAGKERQCSLGVYPAVTLGEAREAGDQVRVLLAAGKDPVQVRRAEREGRLPVSFLLAWGDGRVLTINADGQSMRLNTARAEALRAFLNATQE